MALTTLIISALFIGTTLAQYDCEFDMKHPMQLPGECGNFYLCYQGDRLEYLCRKDQFFNSFTKQCAPKADVTCLPSKDIMGQMCAADASTAFQSDPESCTHYTGCIDGLQYKLKCAHGLFFNPATRACDLAANVKCVGKSTASASSLSGMVNDERCPEGSPNHYQEHPEDCSKYFNCVDDLYYEYDCPADMHFNTTSRACDTQLNAKCSIVIPHPDCPEGAPSYPQLEPDSCIDFFFCYDGTKLSFTCHEDYIFNEETYMCDIYSLGNVCPVGDICEGQPDFTKLPHESDCNIYYKCIGNRSYAANCPLELHFSADRQRCETPETANCTLGATTTTEDVITTTAIVTPTTEEITPTTTEVSNTTEPGLCIGQADYVQLPHEEYCNNYYICLDEEQYLAECPVPLLFDSATCRCVKSEDSNCQTVHCEDFAKFPDSESCNKYFQCMGNTFLEATCPEPLHYNIRQGSCDYKHLAGCQIPV